MTTKKNTAKICSLIFLFILAISLSYIVSSAETNTSGEDAGETQLDEEQQELRDKVQEDISGSEYDPVEGILNAKNVEDHEISHDYIVDKGINEIVTKDEQKIGLSSILSRLDAVKIFEGLVEIIFLPFGSRKDPEKDTAHDTDQEFPHDDKEREIEVSIDGEIYTFLSDEAGSISISKDEEGNNIILSQGITLKLSHGREITSLSDGTEIRIVGESQVDLIGEALVEYTNAYARNPLKVNLFGEGSSLHLQTTDRERFVFKNIDPEKGLEVIIGSYHSTEDCIGNCASYVVEAYNWDKIKIDGNAGLEKHYSEVPYSQTQEYNEVLFVAEFNSGEAKIKHEHLANLFEMQFQYKTVLNYNNEIGLSVETSGKLEYDSNGKNVEIIPSFQIEIEPSDMPSEVREQVTKEIPEKEEITGVWIEGQNQWKHLMDEDKNIFVAHGEADPKYRYDYRGEYDGIGFYEAFEYNTEMGAYLSQRIYFNEKGQQVDAAGRIIEGGRTSSIIGKEISLDHEQETYLMKKYNVQNNLLAQSIDSWIGTRYGYGEDSRHAVDCSALVGRIYKEIYGIQLPRVSRDIYNDNRIRKISRQELKEGDIVFFATKGKTEIRHVGIYLSGNRIFHAGATTHVSIIDMDLLGMDLISGGRIG